MTRDSKSELKRMFEIRDIEVKLLFQRLNYFLVTTAFLIAGFVAIATYSGASNFDDARRIGYVIASAGLILSGLFALINFSNTKALYYLDEYIDNLQDCINDPSKEMPPERKEEIKKIRDKQVKAVKLGWGLLRQLPTDVRAVISLSCCKIDSHPEKHSNDSFEVGNLLTYWVPSLFALIWIALLILLSRL